MDIFNFNYATVFSFFLTLIRISIVLFLLPIFGGKSVPNPVKASIVLVLTLALWPHLSFPGATLPSNLWMIGLMLIGEVTLGLIISILVNLFFASVQFAGSLVGFQMGFSMVNVMDPVTGVNEVVTAHFMYMVTLLIFLALDGHIFLIGGLASTFKLIPPGSLYLSPELYTDVLGLSSKMFSEAVKLASPVIVAVLMVDMSLGIISRVAPQMHLIVLGFPIKIAVGFIFIGFIFTILNQQVRDFVVGFIPLVDNVLSLGKAP